MALLTVADIGLAARWFRERLLCARAASRSAGLSEEQIEAIFNRICRGDCASRPGEASGGAFGPAPSAPAMLGRLLWQETAAVGRDDGGPDRHAAPHGLVLLGQLDSWDQFGARGRAPVPRLPCLVLVFAGLFSAPLLGSSVFLADQTGCRFRFLAEHGIPPRLVWLSRQIRGLLVMLLGLLLVLPPADRNDRNGQQPAGRRCW